MNFENWTADGAVHILLLVIEKKSLLRSEFIRIRKSAGQTTQILDSAQSWERKIQPSVESGEKV